MIPIVEKWINRLTRPIFCTRRMKITSLSVWLNEETYTHNIQLLLPTGLRR